MAARTQPNLAGAAILLMLAFVASRLTGLLRDMVIGNQFGTSAQYEAYLAGNRIPDLVFQVLAGGAVASAFIPVFARHLTRNDMDGAWRLVSSLFNLAVLVLVPVIVLLMVLALPVMELLTPAWPPAQQALAANLARVMLVSPLFFTLGCLATSVLNAHQRFFMPALAPLVYNLGIILGAALLAEGVGGAGLDRSYGLALGAALGSLGFLVIQVPGLNRVGLVYQWVLDWGDASVREVGRLMGPRALGLGVTQLNFVIVLFFASAVPGGYAALNYAWLLTMLPLGVFAIAISTAVFPTMAEQTATDRLAELRRTLSESLRFILYLTVPASVGLIVLGRPVVRLLFERGQFDAASTEATVFALQFYAAALFAQASTEIVARAFYAMRDTLTPLLAAGGAMLLNLVLCAVLVGPLAHGGLALAVSLASIAEAAALTMLLERRLPGFATPALVSLGKFAVAALAMGAVLWALGRLAAPPVGGAGLLAYVVAFVLGGVVVYWSLTAVLRCPEARRLAALVLQGLWERAPRLTHRPRGC